MTRNYLKTDIVILIFVLTLLVGLPLSLRSYDQAVWRDRIPRDAKVFTLTGNNQKGWIMGDVHAFDVLLSNSRQPVIPPRITVSKGDRVVLKIKSSDVVHGFSLKDLGIFVTEGIQPGKVKLVSFVADKVGEFTFSCNAICGDNHENMKGTLVVTA
jgi:heme/copper-type cytochrome/quinol oxidase subunit 2